MGVGASLYMYDVVVKSSRSLSHLLTNSCACMQVPTVHVCRNCNKRKRDSTVAQGVSIFALLDCGKFRNTRNNLEGHYINVISRPSCTIQYIKPNDFCSRPNHDYILHCFQKIFPLI